MSTLIVTRDDAERILITLGVDISWLIGMRFETSSDYETIDDVIAWMYGPTEPPDNTGTIGKVSQKNTA